MNHLRLHIDDAGRCRVEAPDGQTVSGLWYENATPEACLREADGRFVLNDPGRLVIETLACQRQRRGAVAVPWAWPRRWMVPWAGGPGNLVAAPRQDPVARALAVTGAEQRPLQVAAWPKDGPWLGLSTARGWQHWSEGYSPWDVLRGDWNNKCRYQPPDRLGSSHLRLVLVDEDRLEARLPTTPGKLDRVVVVGGETTAAPVRLEDGGRLVCPLENQGWLWLGRSGWQDKEGFKFAFTVQRDGQNRVALVAVRLHDPPGPRLAFVLGAAAYDPGQSELEAGGAPTQDQLALIRTDQGLALAARRDLSLDGCPCDGVLHLLTGGPPRWLRWWTPGLGQRSAEVTPLA